MATTISTQDLIDVKRDIDDIGKAVNEKTIVSPRYGDDFKSLPMIAADAQATIGEWETAIALITQDGGVPALAVSDASGETQQTVNLKGASIWYSKAGGYSVSDTVRLTNGDIVKSTIDGNEDDPNTNMSGWTLLPVTFNTFSDFLARATPFVTNSIIESLEGGSWKIVSSGGDFTHPQTSQQVKIVTKSNGYDIADYGGDLRELILKTLKYSNTGDISSFSQQLPIITLKPGIYYINETINIGTSSTGATLPALRLRAASSGSVIIRIDDGIDGIVIDGVANKDTWLENITFNGGRVQVKYTQNVVTTAAKKVVKNCAFLSFTKAGLVSQQKDSPHWDITGNTFMGAANSEGSVSLALGGYLDNVVIENNRFFRSWVDILIDANMSASAGGISGSLYIEKNDFIHFGSLLEKRANIWFVAGDGSGVGGNATGTIIFSNKFGNENYVSGWSNILVASRITGETNREQYRVDDSFYSNRQLNGISLLSNRFEVFSATTGMQYAVESRIGVLNAWVVAGNNCSKPNGFLAYVGGTPALNQLSWAVHSNKPAGAFGAEFPFPFFSNHPVALLNQRESRNFYETIFESPIASDSLIQDHVPVQNLPSGSTVKTIITGGDIFGGDDMASWKCLTASTGISRSVTAFNSTCRVQAQVDVQKSSSSPVDKVQVCFSHNSSSVRGLKEITLTDSIQTVTIDAILPKTTSGTEWYVLVRPVAPNFAVGVRDTFNAGRLSIARTQGPYNAGHIQTEGTGLWNAAHLVMGSYHIWVDNVGKLRIKNGLPTSATDGALVGV